MSDHGHVTPNADGSKARCGGPGICFSCSKERGDMVVDMIDYRYLNLDTEQFVDSQEELVKQIGIGGTIANYLHYPKGIFIAASKNPFTETDANLCCKRIRERSWRSKVNGEVKS